MLLPALMVLTGPALPAAPTAIEAPRVGLGLADTSTTTRGVAEPGARQTVEDRAFVKGGRVHLRAGLTYLAREDFWISPGVTVEGGYHLSERFAVDLSASAYASTLDAAARELRSTRGLLPDAEQPILRLALGPRWSFVYGKLLVEDLGTVLHFDLSVLLRVGVLVTDRTANPGGDLALGTQLGIDGRWLVFGELSFWAGYEDRVGSSFSGGPAGTVGVGVQL